MKTEINLLPPEIRKARMKRIMNKRVSTMVGSVAMVLAMVCIAYAVAWQSARMRLAQMNEQVISGASDRVDVEKTIRETNAYISSMSKQIIQNPPWTIRIEDVLRVVPVGITITKFDLTENPSVLIVTGKASVGSLVVEYQRALEKLPWVDHVIAPLQNFARAPDAIVTFTIFRKTDNPPKP